MVAGLVAFLPMLRWLTAPATLAAPVALSLVLAAYVGLASIAVQRWTASRAGAVVGPLAWAGMEGVRARFPFGGFGWGDLATAHTTESWMLTSARVLGADGLTLLTALLGGFAWAAVHALRAASQAGHPAEQDGVPLVPGAARAVATFDAARPLVLGTIGVAVLGTLITIGPPEVIGQLDVLVVQGNDGITQLSGLDEDVRIAEAHADETVRAVTDGGVPDLTVWAENAIDRDPASESGAALRAPLARAAAATQGNLLAGVLRAGLSPETFRNSIVAFDEQGVSRGGYDKIRIVPFGEYVPFRELIGDIGPLRRVPRDAIAGEGPVTLDVAGVRVAPIICFETLFAGTVREAVAQDDAGIVVAATNDSSFGRSAESAQHVAQSRLRAIATGRSVVHASISGTSAIIDPDGEIVALGPLFEVASIRATVPVVAGGTPAMVIGPFVSGLLGAAFLALLAVRAIGAAGRRRKDPETEA
jgi:apolipoprotein N-acyltransferase